ncbi:MAG TPA: M20/M25/M40 family metallo-hydrolase [Natronosporangium sp.]|nr:M20/M25/M40 family metallo-hydrolase [Natronosporangium sp.]
MTAVDPVDLLAELVAIDSSNPGPGEAAIARYIDDLARRWGFESRVVETAPGRANVLVRVDAGGSRSLGLSGHLDTKPAGELARWRTPPWELSIDGDLAYGLGTSDMKGALAAMLVAARTWSATARRGRLDLIFTADEEAGSQLGAWELARRGLVDVEAVLVGEPSGITTEWEQLSVVSRGICCFEVTVHGRQGHSGLSERLPTSATVAAARAVLAIDALRPRHPPAGEIPRTPTVNAGVRIGGGVFFGVHPGHATVDCEVRLVPGMRRDELVADVRAALAAAMPADVRWDVRLRPDQLGWLPASEIAADHPLVRAAGDAAAQVLGRKLPLGVYPGGTDASAFSQGAGVPSIASLGPGWLSVAHAPNEHVGRSQVRDAAEIYRRIATAFLEGR